FSTWLAGVVGGVPAGLLDIGTLADLSDIGTLFAFALGGAGGFVFTDSGAGPAAGVPCAGRAAGAGGYDYYLRAADGGIADHELDTILHLAGDWPRDLLFLRPQDGEPKGFRTHPG